MLIPIEGVLIMVGFCCMATGLAVRQWTKRQAGIGYKYMAQRTAHSMVGICYGIIDEAKAHGLPPQEFLDGCMQQAKKYGVEMKKIEPIKGGPNGEHTPDANNPK